MKTCTPGTPPRACKGNNSGSARAVARPHTRKNKEVVMFLPACAFGAVAVARNICCTGCRFRDALQTCTCDVFCYLHGEPCEPFPSRTTFRTRSAPIPAYRHDGCAVCSREYAKLRNNDPPFALIDSWIGRKPIKFDLLPAPPEAPQPRPTGVARTSHALPRASAKVPVAGAAQSLPNAHPSAAGAPSRPRRAFGNATRASGRRSPERPRDVYKRQPARRAWHRG